MSDTEKKMEKTILSLQNNLNSLRTSRANPDLVQQIQVECYGTNVPLSQVASVTAPESRLLLISPYDQNTIKNIEKSLSTSQLNLNPQVDGNIIKIILPELTEDRRKELVKLGKQYVEEAKVSIRQVRRNEIDAIKDQEKNKDLSEDESKKSQSSIQKVTDDFIQKIDEKMIEKEKEIMTI